ncbi:chloride channel protein [Altererythrobacter sp. Root672]|uniref:chloride channel protein n=1 Tax=Altererythrobacter sp. Root672 TaxID=1736584 RepID=UPI0006F2AEC1|nr:chloride channel protein [Altererythrobacter sp. Root672]KRA79722.1 chloride channel protein [Altererythrobacter sp. Root672]
MTIPDSLSAHRPLGDHTTDHRMLMLSGAATLVGTGGAVGAWILLKAIAVATNVFWFGRISDVPSTITDKAWGIGIVAVPVVGSLIVGLMARFGSEKIRGHGIPEAIEAILYGESRLSPKVAVLKPLSSAISIGSGGPFGAEGPIIMTGGAIGSLFAQLFHLSAAERKTLLVAGAAAGMTAIFGTPMAAILLAIEVLLFEWKPRSFVPVVIAVLVSLLWRPILIDSGPLFPAQHAVHLEARLMGIAIAMGVLAGCLASLLSTLLYRIEDLFGRLPVHWMWWPAIGALAVGIGGLIDAHVLGAGYESIRALLEGSPTMRVAVSLLLVKAAVWLIALGSGTSGGVLAPLLLLGGALGFLVGHFLPGGSALWALAGMAGIMSGAMRAPLTAALFAVELTGDFAMLPLTVAASAGAYAVSVLLMRRSILTEKIARRGRHILQEYTVDPFDFLQARQVMTPSPETLPSCMPVSDAASFFANDALHRSYPVIDDERRLVGLASRSDALRWQVEGAPEQATLADILSDASQPFGLPEDSLGKIADLMVDTGVGRIPIVDPATRRVVGLLTRQDLLKVRDVRRGAELTRVRGNEPLAVKRFASVKT